MNIFIHPIFYPYYKVAPIRLVDVGASGGLQSHWKGAEQFLQIVFFEPDQRSFNELQKEQTAEKICINSALYKNKEDINFYLMKKQELSSIYKPNISFIEQIKTLDVQIMQMKKKN